MAEKLLTELNMQMVVLVEEEQDLIQQAQKGMEEQERVVKEIMEEMEATRIMQQEVVEEEQMQ